MSPETRAVWDELRTELNMGQYLDVVGSARGSATADEARRIIEHKTARYTVVRPLQLGAAVVGRADLAEPLARHGRPVGMAFQLRDDALGAFGDPAATGKPVGDDLREGKPTLLMAMARAAATPAQLGVLDAVGSEMDDDTVSEVQQVIVDTGALAQASKRRSRRCSTRPWTRWKGAAQRTRRQGCPGRHSPLRGPPPRLNALWA